jgi:hypothetical protein
MVRIRIYICPYLRFKLCWQYRLQIFNDADPGQRHNKVICDVDLPPEKFLPGTNCVMMMVIMPPWLDFRITSQLPAKIYAGLIITYTIRPFVGISVPWVPEITRVKRPHFFVDDQRHGPLASGITSTICNWSAAELRRSMIGILFHTLSVRRKIEIFDYRHKILNQIFGSHQ